MYELRSKTIDTPKGSPEYLPNTLLFQSDKKNYCTSLSKMIFMYISLQGLYMTLLI